MNPEPADKNRRVLVIDDNRAIHDDFRKILSPDDAAAAALHATEAALYGDSRANVAQTQFDVDSAYQGQEGVAMVKKGLSAERPYAMAFVDVRMPPGWDGVETTRKIWELDPNLQVVLCTAYSDYSWSEMFEKLGRRDGLLILKKPFDTVEAFQLANALTEKWWLHQQHRQKMVELEGRVAERTRELRQTNHALEVEVAEHRRAEESLRLLGSAVEQSKESIVITEAELDLPGPKIVFVNPAFTKMSGLSAEEAIGKTPRILQGPRTDRAVLNRLRQNLQRGEPFEGETVNYRKDGKEFTLEWQIAPIRDASGTLTHFVAIQRDITARKQFEAQSIQSQRMETVGKLAGGVAHEFNSILTAITGQGELVLCDLPPRSPLANNVTEIIRAASRAAALTRQLLAYGRKQFLQPETLDLNQVLAGMQGMFRHVMGGDVNTQIAPGLGLRMVHADAGQIEQVIMNMVMNARDAMPNGGKLTLETANVAFDQGSIGRYPELRAGDYVMLAITDTGAGMSEAVKARAFEPFFSTKEVGQGTGLGLSTCYGIIKQSGGHISVYSEPGRGATFKIYLPQVKSSAGTPVQPLNSPDLPSGTETILLVEDDPALREMAGTLLRRLGYMVLSAANGIDALSLKQQRGIGHIDLLFTDVVMPHMSGKELADRVRTLFPHTRVLFTSAYTENAIVHQGVLDQGVALLQKPFTPSALAHKLREVLDQPAAPSPNAAPKTTEITQIKREIKIS
ncbi:MAG TPA: response regulator [Verrucomicrobiae bacterium]|nr:response regulator [Verrucomicrobiae bacterium]